MNRNATADSCLSGESGGARITGEILTAYRQEPRSRLAQQMTEEVGRRLAGLVRKRLVQELNVVHAVDAEKTEIIAQLAPRRGSPKRRIEPEAQRTHLATGLGALLVAISEADFLAPANRGA